MVNNTLGLEDMAGTTLRRGAKNGRGKGGLKLAAATMGAAYMLFLPGVAQGSAAAEAHPHQGKVKVRQDKE